MHVPPEIRRPHLSSFVLACLLVSHLPVSAAPVTGWTQTGGTATPLTGAASNSPTIGTGAANSASPVSVAGQFASTTLDVGQSLLLSGTCTVTFTGNPLSQLRFGLYDDNAGTYTGYYVSPTSYSFTSGYLSGGTSIPGSGQSSGAYTAAALSGQPIQFQFRLTRTSSTQGNFYASFVGGGYTYATSASNVTIQPASFTFNAAGLLIGASTDASQAVLANVNAAITTDVYLGGTWSIGEAGMHDLAVASYNANYRALGGGLYVHEIGWDATSSADQSTISTTFPAPPIWESSFPVEHIESILSTRLPGHWNSVEILCLDSPSDNIADWQQLQSDLGTKAAKLAPILGPNSGEWQTYPWSDSHWDFIRQAALLGGAIATDAPPSFYFTQPEGYREFIADMMTWGHANGVTVVGLLFPYNTADFWENTAAYMADLQARGARPDKWAVDCYWSNTQSARTVHPIGSETIYDDCAYTGLQLCQWFSAGLPALPDSTYRLTNVNSANCLDVTGTASNTPTEQNTASTAASQQWSSTYLGGGQYELTGVPSGLVLNIAGASTANNALVTIDSWTNATNQKWTLTPFSGGGGAWTIEAVNTGKALNVNGGSMAAGAAVNQLTLDNLGQQQWLFGPP